ncbi:hypothetical protein HS1_000888 [Candidatus Desulfofervidus auxilii]|uniref:Uncharacterized protein n=1 Tax=Desulfofervidus auxilii TaxID=1621989 RepID=A0A7U4QJV3_DESA2|nr:hypothetical protein [Candidatus Desulfofervidus auxilii]AMM40692.1 hypothetical protein HS1_000888 [Candidatus Desulfofervidus auxilii]
MKKETVKLRINTKVYKRIARDLYPILPTRVYQNKKSITGRKPGLL